MLCPTGTAVLTSIETSILPQTWGSLTALLASVFTTQIFDIFTGPTKGHFMAHEAVLTQSPLIARLIQTHSTKKGKLKTTLVFPRESPANFGVLLGYLYSHQLVMPSLNGEGLLSSDTDGTEAKAAAKVLARLYVLVGRAFPPCFIYTAMYNIQDIQCYGYSEQWSERIMMLMLTT